MSAPTPIWRPAGSTSLLYFTPDTGPIQLADRVTITDIYQGTYNTCVGAVLRRGTFGTGSRAGWVVTSCKVDQSRGNVGKLTINWEAGGPSADSSFLPLDDFEEESIELNPKVERHPHFLGTTWPGNPNDKISEETITLAYDAAHASTISGRQSALDSLNKLYTDDPDQYAWGIVLLDLLRSGGESYYLGGTRYRWHWHSFTLPPTSIARPSPDYYRTLGGFRQAPRGPLAGSLPSNMQWLRLADTVSPVGVNGSCYKITSTWLGGPSGHWSDILYA
jgi:hypothetical protein